MNFITRKYLQKKERNDHSISKMSTKGRVPILVRFGSVKRTQIRHQTGLILSPPRWRNKVSAKIHCTRTPDNDGGRFRVRVRCLLPRVGHRTSAPSTQHLDPSLILHSQGQDWHPPRSRMPKHSRAHTATQQPRFSFGF